MDAIRTDRIDKLLSSQRTRSS